MRSSVRHNPCYVMLKLPRQILVRVRRTFGLLCLFLVSFWINIRILLQPAEPWRRHDFKSIGGGEIYGIEPMQRPNHSSSWAQQAPNVHSNDKTISVNNNAFPPKERSMGLAIVMFSHLATTDRFENFFLPALETWWYNETEPIYVVLAHQWRTAYKDMCQQRNCTQIYPLWVDCPESGFGESPCCKQEKGLVMLPKSYQWTLFADDDMYFRIGAIRTYLTQFLAVDPAEVYIVTAGGKSAKFLGQSGYKSIRQTQYRCSVREEFRYPWGQPVIYSRAALDLVESGFRAGGLVKQCIEFNVTHDVGNAIFHWMYQIPDYAIRCHTIPGTGVASEAFGVHGIHRYISKLNRTITMYDVHMQALNQTKHGFRKYMKLRHHRLGYVQSETFAKYGNPSSWGNTWHTLPVQDCMDEEQRKNDGMNFILHSTQQG